MKSIFKWVHLSDVHFQLQTAAFNSDNLKQALPKYLEEKVKNCNALILTGDYRFAPEREQNPTEVAEYVLQLSKALRVGSNIYAVPGNHDLNRSTGRVYLMKGAQGDYNPEVGTINSDVKSRLLKDFTFFDSLCSKLNISLPKEGNPHWAASLQNCNILLFNTAITAGCDEDAGNLILGSKYIKDLIDNGIDKTKPTIAIGHHSLEELSRPEKEVVTTFLERKCIFLYLCGHAHEHRYHSYAEHVKEVTVGCLKQENQSVMATFAEGELFEDGTVTITSHKWDIAAQGWYEDPPRKRKWDGLYPEYTTELFHPNELKSVTELSSTQAVISPSICCTAKHPIGLPTYKSNNEQIFAADNIKLVVTAFFDGLAKAHPDVRSYEFIYHIHCWFLPYEKNPAFHKMMQEILDLDVCKDSNGTPVRFKKTNTSRRDFAIYYCLGLYCKRQNKVDRGDLCLKKLIDRYGALFSNFPLHYEIEGWFHRRKVDLVKLEKSKIEHLRAAEECDREMMRQISIDENAGVYNSFASSVSKKLESEYNWECRTLWETQEERMKDWTEALSYFPKIIENYKVIWNSESDYGKHHFILGKLYLYAPNSRIITPTARKDQINKAKNEFNTAIQCEASDDPDHESRRVEYAKYIQECNWQFQKIEKDGASTGVYSIRCDYSERINTRPRLRKPNEDFQLCNEEYGIFVIADGVTRPHSEYRDPTLCNLAAECAREACQSIHGSLIQSKNSNEDPIDRMKKALIAGNSRVRTLKRTKWEARVSNLASSYPPCCTILLALFLGDTLYFYNCCDTVGYLIRNNVKMQFTERYNWRAEREGVVKDIVYRELHNNRENKAGFAIINGDDGFQDFIQIGQLKVTTGDRIILSSDGLAEFLAATNGYDLCKMTAEDMMQQSVSFDQVPFRKYADDKSCIIVDIL